MVRAGVDAADRISLHRGRDAMKPNPRPPTPLPESFVESDAQLAELCEHLSHCEVAAFDTEFIGEESYHPHLCLIQIATRQRLVIIDPLSVRDLSPLWRLLTDGGRVIVVHAGREEVRSCRHEGGQVPARLFDVQIAAGLVGLNYPAGYASLVQQLLGVQLDKGETMTDWSQRPLTERQLRYAYDDVRHLLPIHDAIARRLDKLDRRDWAEEEFRGLIEHAAPPQPDRERWRKLRGLGGLDRRRLAIVRDMHAWRDRTAQAANRPVRTILRDELIIEIAKRSPQTDADVQALRGLPRHAAEEALRVSRAARKLTPAECPQPEERDTELPQTGMLTGLLVSALGDLCARQRLALNLAASSHDLRQLVRWRQRGGERPADHPLFHGWRASAILPEMLALLDGRKRLGIADVNAQSPLSWSDGLTDH